MDLTSLISQLVDAGIGDVATIVIVVLYIRYSSSETRREISKEIDDKIGAAKSDFQQSFQELRQEIKGARTYSEQSHQELRQEIKDARTYSEQMHQELRQEIKGARTYSEQSHQETRQEIREVRTYSEQMHQETRQEMKEIMLHLIDVRERLANIEGRLGAPTPRMSGVSPPLDAPAEEPSAQR